jgi:hypothetical protein
MFNIELGFIKHTVNKLTKTKCYLGTLHSSRRLKISSNTRFVILHSTWIQL